MSGSERDRLAPVAEGLIARPLQSPADLIAGLIGNLIANGPPEASCWGFYTTPAEARLLRGSRARWEAVAAHPHLQELRLFGPERDLHWLGDRGVELAAVPLAGPPAPDQVVGAGWLQRDRRSRLWGEHLEGTDTWYEERIPDPLRYEGLDPRHRYAFLVYREYIQAGAVRYVRYLGVEGGS